MMRRSLIFVWLFLLFLAPTTASASTFQMWTKVGLRYDISEQFRIKFDQHLRFEENTSIMPQLAISYRLAKFLKLEAGYRFTLEIVEDAQDTSLDPWHRFYADIRPRIRFKPFTLNYRLRFQEQYGYPSDNDSLIKVKHTIRNRIKVAWKLPKGFAPFLSGELFNRIDDADGIWHKYRAGIGLEYKTADHVIRGSYRFEEFLFDDPDNEVQHILALNYRYSF